MSALWSLPQAAPILLRHLNAYAALAAQDLARSRENLAARIGAAVCVAFGLFFTLLMTCVAIIAATWDTSYRMAAILALLGFFLLVTILAGNYAARTRRERLPLFASVQREWAIDRVILERILSGGEEGAEADETQHEAHAYAARGTGTRPAAMSKGRPS